MWKGDKMAGKIKLTKLENTSILRKFTILFILMSILPMGVLYYLYSQVKDRGQIAITESEFNLTLSLVAVGVFVGFVVMRQVLRGLINVAKVNRDTLEDVLGHDKVKELADNNNEVALIARTFAEVTSHLEENVKSLESAKKTLHSVLSKVGQGISSMENIDTFLNLILETVTEAFSARVGVLLLVNEERRELYAKSVYGVQNVSIEHFRLPIDEGIFNPLFQLKKSLLVPRGELSEKDSPRPENSLIFYPLVCAPLVLHEKVMGILSVSGRKTDEQFKEEDVTLLSNIAMQTAVAIENSVLNKSAEKIYFETISALALAVEAKDSYSRGHLDRVSEYAVRIAKKFNLDEEAIQILRDGARLHDLGKIGISDEVLRKSSQLNAGEWEMMRRHTEIGEGIIKPIKSLKKLCDVIRHHHEKLDGSGYPDGLKGEEISLLARILSVADIFDALTTDRPYRKAFSFDEAKNELIRMKGKLDSKVVDAFLETLEEQKK